MRREYRLAALPDSATVRELRACGSPFSSVVGASLE
jgi:hypothetical protein